MLILPVTQSCATFPSPPKQAPAECGSGHMVTGSIFSGTGLPRVRRPDPKNPGPLSSKNRHGSGAGSRVRQG